MTTEQPRGSLPAMTNSDRWGLLEALLAVAVAILLSAIPWAYSVHGRVTMIEASQTSISEALQNIARNAERMYSFERRLHALEGKVSTDAKTTEDIRQDMRDLLNRLKTTPADVLRHLQGKNP